MTPVGPALLRPLPLLLLLQPPIQLLNAIKRQTDLVEAGLVVVGVVGLGEEGEGAHYILLRASEDAQLAEDVILVEVLMSLPLLPLRRLQVLAAGRCRPLSPYCCLCLRTGRWRRGLIRNRLCIRLALHMRC